MGLREIDKFVSWNAANKYYAPTMWRRDVLPSWITFVETTPIPITVPAAPALAGINGTIEQPYTSLEGMDRGLGTPFEVRSLVFQSRTGGADDTATVNMLVRLKEVGETRDFMNRGIHVRTMFGTGQLPALLREPMFLLSKHNINVNLAMVAGGPSAIRLYGVGAQYYPWSPGLVQSKEKQPVVDLLKKWINRRRYVTPFWMTTDTDVLLPGTLNAQSNNSLKIGDDGQFEIFGHAAISTGEFGFEIYEPKTKQTLSNGIVSSLGEVGTALLPTIYPVPYLVPAGIRLNMRFTNLTAAPNSVWWTFFGRRIYSPISQVQEVLQDTAVPTPADTPTQMVPAPF